MYRNNILSADKKPVDQGINMKLLYNYLIYKLISIIIILLYFPSIAFSNNVAIQYPAIKEEILKKQLLFQLEYNDNKTSEEKKHIIREK